MNILKKIVMRMMFKTFKILKLVIFILFFAACSSNRYYEKRGFALDTFFSIKLPVDSQEECDNIFNDITGLINNLAEKMNAYDTESEISLINMNAGKKKVKVSPETFDLLRDSLKISRLTYGRFDISTFTIIKYWDFEIKKVVPFREIERYKKYINYKKIKLNGNTGEVFLPDTGINIGLGGILKGYVVDRIKERLEKKYHIDNGIINAGGDMFCLGMKNGKEPWHIGIQHPRDNSKIYKVINVENKAVATSGDYEQYFIMDGKRYCHILIPETGMPADFYKSVTVIADSVLTADALATAVFAGGPKYLDKIKSNFPDVKVIIIE